MKNFFFLILSVLLVINAFAQKTKAKTTVKKTVPKTTTATKAASSATAPKTTTTTTTKKATPKKATYTTTKADTATMNLICAEMCTCMSPKIDSLHPALLAMFEDMLNLGVAKAQENLKVKIEAMSADEKAKFEKSSANMESFGNEVAGDDPCLKKIEKKYKNLKFDDKPGKDEAMQKLMIYTLEQQCKNVATVMKLGAVSEK